MTRFWRFQLFGWLAYGLAMALSRLGRFPLDYMVASKGLLALTGFLCSLVLWQGYRRLLRREWPIARLVVVAVVASYLMAMVWTAIDNLANVPIAGVLLGRTEPIRSLFGLFVGAVYNAFALLAWSVLYLAIRHHDAWLAARERALQAEALASRTRLETLRYQLQPHLLFNTLNGISTLVTEQRNDEASRMLSRLSDFLRLLLTVPPNDLVELAAEIDLIERYLEIERVRFGERLTVTVAVEESAWPARVPPLLLQPVVENAIRHGIAPKEGPGTVAITANRVGRHLKITVTDDAAPYSELGVAGNGERIGLANVRERLERLWPANHRLAIVSTDRGTTVTLEMPFAAEAAP